LLPVLEEVIASALVRGVSLSFLVATLIPLEFMLMRQLRMGSGQARKANWIIRGPRLWCKEYQTSRTGSVEVALHPGASKLTDHAWVMSSLISLHSGLRGAGLVSIWIYWRWPNLTQG
jgi:hypothetical protein